MFVPQMPGVYSRDLGVVRVPTWVGSSAQNDFVVVGEIGHRAAPRKTDKHAQLLRHVVQCDRECERKRIAAPESKNDHVIRDENPLCVPDESVLLSGQLEPGLLLCASPTAVEGSEVWHSRLRQDVAGINPERGGSSAREAAGTSQIDSAARLSEISAGEFDSKVD